MIDVHSQEAIVMNVKEFCEAFETPVENRTSVLNCLSLEVTNLPLGDVLMPPLVARMLCWVTNVWPQSIQEQWEGGEPPQVQKYCIMSMQGSYTGKNSTFKSQQNQQNPSFLLYPWLAWLLPIIWSSNPPALASSTSGPTRIIF